jgi:hypothetical protein
MAYNTIAAIRMATNVMLEGADATRATIAYTRQIGGEMTRITSNAASTFAESSRRTTARGSQSRRWR